ncbi:MAG: hypothetical protein A49_27950 [Methyloceanibacter sp.]|nr:MAG: hypothetical protein A49_27950 [Methyloceanibacter sp.]
MWGTRRLRVFDTAGLRRKARIEARAEILSVGDTLKAIKFAEVVVLLLDAEQPFEKQDLQIADLVAQEGRALVIAINKWDLVTEKQARLAELREMCGRLLPQVKGVSLVTLSAKSGKGVDRLMDAVLAADEIWNRRLPTAKLNDWLASMVDAHPPPAVAGRRPEDPLHDAGKRASADLRGVLLAAQGAPGLLCPLSRERLTGGLRLARRSDPFQPAQGSESLCEGAVVTNGETEVYFYHLESRTLEQVLPALLERSLERGWRAAVQAASPERVEALNTLLWTYRDDSFLPHGAASDGAPESQPVYLTDGEANPNDAAVRFLVDGATLDDAAPYTRVVHIFDGHDDGAVARARAAWATAKTQGYSISYWQQDEEGRWQQKA